MKLGIVGTELAPLDAKIGALEKLCIGWADQLRRKGHEVLLFSIPLDGRSSEESRNIFTFENQADLDFKLQNASLDGVIVNNRPMWNAGNIKNRINLFHNYPDAWMAESCEKLTNYVAAARNLAVSAALAETVNGSFPGAGTRVLYPFVDPDIIGSCDIARFRKSPSGSQKLRILFPNRTMEKKGLRWLISAIDQHLADKVCLTVIRNISPWADETEEHRGLLNLARMRSYASIQEKILNPSDLVELYQAHDVVVAPSIQPEGLGLIPLEAQAAGIPVVASDLGGLKESVFPPNITVQTGSDDQLAHALVAASRISPTDRERVAKMVRRKFSQSESANLLEAELANLLDSHRLR